MIRQLVVLIANLRTLEFVHISRRPTASDPAQLGLKLESRKRLMPGVVIDQMEQKPTVN